MLAKFGVPFDKATPLVHFPKRLKRPRNTARPASSRFSWRKVLNGVKCNFSSSHHQVRNIVGKPSIRRVRMLNFTRIGPKTKKLWLSIVPVQKPSEQPGLGPP